MMSLHQLLAKLDIGRHEEDDVFLEELRKTDLSIFHPLSDLGYYSWEPNDATYKSLSSIKSETEVLCYIDLHGKPNRLKPIWQIETLKRFECPDRNEFENKCPYGEHEFVCFHVAVKIRTSLKFKI